MARVKRMLEDPETERIEEAEARVLDAETDARREAAQASREIRDLGRRVSFAKRRWDAAEAAEREARSRVETHADYREAIRLGYVWAAIVVIVTTAVTLTQLGILK